MWGRYRRWPRVRPLVYAMLFAALVGWMALRGSPGHKLELGAFSSSAPTVRAGRCEVIAVIDGDTLLVRQAAANSEGQDFVGEVRLLGLNTPATAQRGKASQLWAGEATKFAQQQVDKGNVRLQLDKRRIDRNGRCLAYVYVGDVHLSEALVAAGLARVHTYPGDSMTINRQLLRAQDEARRRQLGIWSAEDPRAIAMKNED